MWGFAVTLQMPFLIYSQPPSHNKTLHKGGERHIHTLITPSNSGLFRRRKRNVLVYYQLNVSGIPLVEILITSPICKAVENNHEHSNETLPITI